MHWQLACRKPLLIWVLGALSHISETQGLFEVVLLLLEYLFPRLLGLLIAYLGLLLHSRCFVAVSGNHIIVRRNHAITLAFMLLGQSKCLVTDLLRFFGLLRTIVIGQCQLKKLAPLLDSKGISTLAGSNTDQVFACLCVITPVLCEVKRR